MPVPRHQRGQSRPCCLCDAGLLLSIGAGLQGRWDPARWCCHASQTPASAVVKHPSLAFWLVAEMSFILYFVPPPKKCRRLAHSDYRWKDFLSASPLPLGSTTGKEEHGLRRGLTFLLSGAQDIKCFLQCPGKEIDWSFFTLGDHFMKAFWIFLWS